MSDQGDNPNLGLWEAVKTTHPSYTRQVTLDGRQVTTLPGTYMVLRATEQFGPIGKGWGYDIVEERYDTGKPLYDKGSGEFMGAQQTHTLRLRLWYVDEDPLNPGQMAKCAVEHYGHTPYLYQTSGGYLRVDPEAPKKSLTDALKKCLSMLGFSADVYLGQFDDDKYVHAMAQREAVEQADKADEDFARQRTDFYEWLDNAIKDYHACPTVAALKTLHQATDRKAGRQAELVGIDRDKIHERLDKAYKAAYQEIAPPIDIVCKSCGVPAKGRPGDPCGECGEKTRAQ